MANPNIQLPNTAFGGTPWRDYNGEDRMNQNDWQARRTQKEIGKMVGKDDDDCCPDLDRTGTWGCYNGDWSAEDHEAYNLLLEVDPAYRAKIAGDLEILRRLERDHGLD